MKSIKQTRWMNGTRQMIATFSLAVVLGLMSIGCSTTGGSLSPEEMKQVQAQAEQGDPDAMMRLGDAYMASDNFAEAQKWYEKAEAAFEGKK